MHRILRIALALTLTGCVTTGEFNKQVEKTEAEKKRADDTGKELEAAKQTLGEQKASLEANQKSLSELQSKLSAGDTQIADLQSRLKAEEDQLAALQKSNKSLTDSLSANQNELKQKVSSLVKQVDELNGKIADDTQKLGTLTSKLQQVQTEKDGLAQQLQQTQADRDSLTSKLQQAQTEKETLQKQKDEELSRVKKSYEDVTAGLKSEIDKGAVQIKQLQGKLTLNLVDKVLFRPGEADVNEEGRKVLNSIGEVLNRLADKDIRIEGHTDDRPITGELKARFPTNWELSAARATAVARFLQDNAHVDPKRLIVAGFGQFRPVSPNDTAENRALNRRIELVLVPRD